MFLSLLFKVFLLMLSKELKYSDTAVIFVHHCTEFVRKHRHFVGSDGEMTVQLEYILK